MTTRSTTLIAALAVLAAPLALSACGQEPAATEATTIEAAAPTADPELVAAIAAPGRAEADRARDVWRHPAETLAFFGVKPGATVLEIFPGGGWWTDILAPYTAKTGGRYIAAGPAPDSDGGKAFLEKYSDADRFGQVEAVALNAPQGQLAAPNSVDVAFTSRNVHNWVGEPGRVDAVFQNVFAVLKPGGTFGVVDHRADPNPMKDGASDGYVSEAYVIEAARRAGFVLDARSEINANPKDTKDHPFGVWTLPPTRTTAAEGQETAPDFDAAKYEAIGESDRMTLRFRKPA